MQVRSALGANKYPTGRSVSDAEAETLDNGRDAFHRRGRDDHERGRHPTIGVILMIVGGIGPVMTLLFLMSFSPFGGERRGHVDVVSRDDTPVA